MLTSVPELLQRTFDAGLLLRKAFLAVIESTSSIVEAVLDRGLNNFIDLTPLIVRDKLPTGS